MEAPDGRVTFKINPGHVFGTGLHQTTQLCMLQLEKYIDENSVVADLGCGSGILSVVALLLGARVPLLLILMQMLLKQLMKMLTLVV